MGAFGDSSAYQTTAGTTDEVMGWTQSSDDVGVAYASISEIATQPNYEIEIKYGWETETCVDTRRLTINAWHTTSENILVQLYDSNELNPATRLTITATSDGTTLTYDLSSDEWDSGDPDLRFLGNTESGDSIQTDLLNDLTIISCVPPLDYELEVKFSWSGISTTGTEWRLFIEGLEGSNPEQIDIRIYDSDEIGLSAIVCSITSITETEYDCGILTTDQLDSGNPDIQIVDNNQASDSLQSTLLLDRTRIQRTFNFYRINQVHHWTMTVDLADSYELRVRSLRSDEDMFVQIWDWMASSWNTRITVNTGSETLYTYTLVSTERDTDGYVLTRWLGSSETSSDEIQSTVTTDQEIILRSFNPDYEVNVRYSFVSVNTTGISWTFSIECKRVLNAENLFIQIVDSTETIWNTRYTCSTDSDFTYSTYTLTTDELDGGSPDIRVIGTNEIGDSEQSSWDLDMIKIIRDFIPPSIGEPASFQSWVLFGILVTSGLIFAITFIIVVITDKRRK